MRRAGGRRDGVEILEADLLSEPPADVPRVVDQDVDAAVVVERGADNRCSPPAAVATESVDATASPPAAMISADHVMCGAGVDAVAGEAAADVVDDDLGATRCQQQIA